mmetsp:Transcript_104833/g.240328  ORF Transcript_104833/g.240328 Transcript_104833/m.240328 type:complete len:115 (+) Transcript_104833:1308-1652(+)
MFPCLVNFVSYTCTVLCKMCSSSCSPCLVKDAFIASMSFPYSGGGNESVFGLAQGLPRDALASLSTADKHVSMPGQFRFIYMYGFVQDVLVKLQPVLGQRRFHRIHEFPVLWWR